MTPRGMPVTLEGTAMTPRGMAVTLEEAQPRERYDNVASLQDIRQAHPGSGRRGTGKLTILGVG